MSKSNEFENDLLRHMLNNTPIAGVGDTNGLPASATAGNLFLRLHSADPGEAGAQNTNEIAYTGYAAVAIPRTTTGFTVAANVATNTNAITFPACTGGTAAARFWSLGTAATGAGKVLYKGQLIPSGGVAGDPLNISVGITPQVPAGQLSITED